MLEIEPKDCKLRTKRPERQLYVPPAQRKSSLNESQNNKNKYKTHTAINRENDQEITLNHKKSGYGNKTKSNSETVGKINCQKPVESSNSNISVFEFLWFRYLFQTRCTFVISGSHLKFQKSYNFNDYQNKYAFIENVLPQIPLIVFYLNSSNLYQEKIIDDHKNYFCKDFAPFYITKHDFQYSHFNQTVERVPLIVNDTPYSYSNSLKQVYIFSDYDTYSIGNTLFINNSYNKYFRYLHIILECSLLEKQNSCIFDIINNIADRSNSFSSSNKDNASASDNILTPFRNNNKNKTDSQKNMFENSMRKKQLLEKTDHEEEVEIMRKTKEHINRKTRPIMKYVGELNNTLNIGGDSVKSWEDLFDDEGEFKEELLGVETLNKSKKNTKSKNNLIPSESTEDIKHIEELEHMVELYDFPSSFKTHDLIQAFSNIDCDAMYIKWVEDTRAILVLGTLTQAMKAVSLKNPLIKVRPMTTASRVTLAIAHKNDLKPAMKRPPTNLQTARRFITAALGTKIGVSREKAAKEREDLKAAKEMKKLMKKNEHDAWEGKLQSSLH